MCASFYTFPTQSTPLPPLPDHPIIRSASLNAISLPINIPTQRGSDRAAPISRERTTTSINCVQEYASHSPVSAPPPYLSPDVDHGANISPLLSPVFPQPSSLPVSSAGCTAYSHAYHPTKSSTTRPSGPSTRSRDLVFRHCSSWIFWYERSKAHQKRKYRSLERTWRANLKFAWAFFRYGYSSWWRRRSDNAQVSNKHLQPIWHALIS